MRINSYLNTHNVGINVDNYAAIEKALLDFDKRRLERQKQVADLLVVKNDDKELAKFERQVATALSKAFIGYNAELNVIFPKRKGQ